MTKTQDKPDPTDVLEHIKTKAIVVSANSTIHVIVLWCLPYVLEWLGVGNQVHSVFQKLAVLIAVATVIALIFFYAVYRYIYHKYSFKA